MRAYQPYDNKILLELLSRNDETAYTEIYNRYWEKLYTASYIRLREAEASEDIVHDIFVSLWINRKKLVITSLENYLMTAVKYKVLDNIKIRQRQRYYQQSFPSSSYSELQGDLLLHHKHMLQLLQQEVKKLPEKCRLIFTYRRDEEMPVKEIAGKMHISPKTVENQLNKAQKQLKLAAKSFLHFCLFIPQLFS